MITYTKITRTAFLKPVKEDSENFFARTWIEGIDGFSWRIAHLSEAINLPAFTGGELNFDLCKELEKEYQEALIPRARAVYLKNNDFVRYSVDVVLDGIVHLYQTDSPNIRNERNLLDFQMEFTLLR